MQLFYFNLRPSRDLFFSLLYSRIICNARCNRSCTILIIKAGKKKEGAGQFASYFSYVPFIQRKSFKIEMRLLFFYIVYYKFSRIEVKDLLMLFTEIKNRNKDQIYNNYHNPYFCKEFNRSARQMLTNPKRFYAILISIIHVNSFLIDMWQAINNLQPILFNKCPLFYFLKNNVDI